MTSDLFQNVSGQWVAANLPVPVLADVLGERPQGVSHNEQARESTKKHALRAETSKGLRRVVTTGDSRGGQNSFDGDRRRFSGKVRIDVSGCHIWTSNKNWAGYGQFHFGGRPVTASRVAYELYIGPIPSGMWVLHRCDNPSCVNPAHLFLGTRSDNSRDMIQKGRGSCQFVNGDPRHAKLSVAKVADIKRRLVLGAPPRELANQYGVAPCTISHISAGRTWTHVKTPLSKTS